MVVLLVTPFNDYDSYARKFSRTAFMARTSLPSIRHWTICVGLRWSLALMHNTATKNFESARTVKRPFSRSFKHRFHCARLR